MCIIHLVWLTTDSRAPSTSSSRRSRYKSQICGRRLQIRLSCRWIVEMVEGYVACAVPKGRGSTCQKGQFSAWLHSAGLLVTLERMRNWRLTPSPFLSLSSLLTLCVPTRCVRALLWALIPEEITLCSRQRDTHSSARASFKGKSYHHTYHRWSTEC